LALKDNQLHGFHGLREITHAIRKKHGKAWTQSMDKAWTPMKWRKAWMEKKEKHGHPFI
jgi:hypothetical protein